MNMMFSALWGVGYVVVQYRKNGTLKRLKATPLTPLEYLSAQMLSRIFLIMFTIIVVWIGSNLIFHFQVQGSRIAPPLDLFPRWPQSLFHRPRPGRPRHQRRVHQRHSQLHLLADDVSFGGLVFPRRLSRLVQDFAQIFPLTHLLTSRPQES